MSPLRMRVGTSNPLKTKAVRRAAESYFGVSCRVESTPVQTSDEGTPACDEDAIAAARERARTALAAGECDIGVGVESSVRFTNYGGYITCWVVVMDNVGRESVGAGPQLRLPDVVANAARTGVDLRDALEAASLHFISDAAASPIDFLTCNVFSREQMVFMAALMAMAETARRVMQRDI